MQFESPQRIPIKGDVIVALAVTRLAGDPELGHLRVPFVLSYKPRLPLGDVTIHTRAVPCADRVIFFELGREEECFAYRRPHLFPNNVSKGELLERSAL